MAAVVLTTAAANFLDDAARGGSLATVFVLSFLLLAPLNASWADRFGARPVLVVQMVSSVVCWSALTALVAAHAPYWSWYLPVIGAGLSLAGVSAVLRSTLPLAVHPNQLRVASSLDAALMDVVIVAAPLLVSVAGAIAPICAVGVVAVVSAAAAGTVTLLPRRPSQPATPTQTISGPDLGDPDGIRADRASTPTLTRRRRRLPLLAWAAGATSFGVLLGSLEIGAVSLVQASGRSVHAAWVVFAVLAGSSVAGGLADAGTARWDRGGHRSRHAALFVLMIAGGLTVTWSGSWNVTLLGIALVGLPSSSLLSALARRTEVLTTSGGARSLAVMYAVYSVGYGAAGLLLALGPRTDTTIATICLAGTAITVLATDR